MHIVLGATGRVGSAVARVLLAQGEPVTVVTRNPHRAEPFARLGAVPAIADIHDVDALRAVLRQGRSAYLLMPPADPSTDTVAEERRSVASIVRALRGTNLQKVVVQSTYGAQPGEGLGDLGVLYDFEQAVTALGVRASVIRAAYFMSNWEWTLGTARDEGVLHTFFPPEFALPMVAPADVGRTAARMLTKDIDHTGVCYVEGPARYSAADAARVFAAALGREVRTVETPRSATVASLRELGFSAVAADSYARMIATTVEHPERPEAPERMRTTLDEYLSALVHQA